MSNAARDALAKRLLAESAWVRALAGRLTARDHADDVTQETWRVALERPPLLDGARANLRGWLSTVLRNVVRRRHRDEERLRNERPVAPSDHDLKSHNSLERAELQRELADAVLGLAEPYRTAVVLRYFDGLDSVEIASRLGVTESAVRKRLSRAIGMLRERLDQEHGGDRHAWFVAYWSAASPAVGSTAISGVITMGVKSIATACALLLIAAVTFRAFSTRPMSPTRGDSGSHETASLDPVVLASADSGSENQRTPVVPTSQVIDRDRDLHGLVLAPNGLPVGGATIRLDRDELSEFLVPSLTRREVVAFESTLTDSLGRFSVPLPIGREVGLAVEASGFPTSYVEYCHAGEYVEVRLEVGARLTGRVTLRRGGQPAAGARVWLVDPANSRGTHARVHVSTQTDTTGTYEFGPLTSGRRWLQVESDHAELFSANVDIASGAETTFDISLNDGVVIVGRVLDAATLQPIVDAEVAPRGFRRVARTDTQGRFRYAGFPSVGDEYVYARASGYAGTEQRIFDDSGTPKSDDIEIKMTRGRLVRGRVVDREGAPIGGVFVAALSARSGPRRSQSDCASARSQPDGRFEILAVRADLAHLLWLKLEGYATLAFAFPDQEFELPEIEFGDIVLPPGATLRGAVVDDAGQPIAHREVHLRGVNEDARRYTATASNSRANARAVRQVRVGQTDAWQYIGDRESRTDDLGRFAFVDLGAGDYVLSARPEGASDEESLAVRVAAGQATDGVLLVMPRGQSIEGQVVSPTGEPVFSFVCAMTGRGGRQVSVYTDARGHFRLGGLEATTYEVLATPQARAGAGSPQAQWMQARATAVRAGTTDLRLVVAPSGTINGVVRVCEGRSLDRVRVEVRSRSNGDSRWVELDEHGAFTAKVRTDDVYDVYARPMTPREPGSTELHLDLDDAHAGVVLAVTSESGPVEMFIP